MSASGSSSGRPQQQQFSPSQDGFLSPLTFTPDPQTIHDLPLPLDSSGQHQFSSWVSPQIRDTVRSAGHDTLLKFQNAAYSNVLSKYHQLYARHEMLIAAYSTLASAIPQIFHYIPNPMQIPIPSSSAAGSTSTNPAVNPFTTHAEENFPEIHYWRRKEFLTDDVIDLDGDTEKVGKLGFLEHVNGIRFTAEELKSVRKHAYESFADLLEDGIAPQKWSQASSTATQRVRHAIISHHPEISLCADNWKVDAVVTETYGHWTTRRKEQIAASSQRRQQVKESTTKSRSSKRKHEGGADDAGRSKRSKQHGEAERSGVMNKSKERKKKRKHKQDDPDLPPRSVSPPASNNAEIDMDMGLDSDFDLGRDLDLNYDADEDDAPVNEKDLSKLLDDDDTSGRNPGSSSHETRPGIASFATPPPLNGPEDADSVAGSPEPSPAKPKKITLSNPLLRAKAKGGAKGKGKETAASADVTNPPVTAAPPASTSPTIPPALNKATAAPTDLANSTAAASGSSSAPTFASASPFAAEDPSTNLSTPAVRAAAAGKPKKAKSEKPYKPGEPDTAWNLWTREYQKTHSATGKELHEIWDTMDKTKYQVAAAAAKEKTRIRRASSHINQRNCSEEGRDEGGIGFIACFEETAALHSLYSVVG
ncbi:hypothetical protein C8R47DRAFT_258093 [Mycena vitilis]|nr:hypothetical protein C8R47DRAFT_258093 [Mycena vitilis]